MYTQAYIWKWICSFLNQLYYLINLLVSLRQQFFSNKKSCVIYLETSERKFFSDWKPRKIMVYYIHQAEILCYGTLSTPEQNDVISLLSLLLTLVI